MEERAVIRRLWNDALTWLRNFKRTMILERPTGLKTLGDASVIKRPRVLWGREHIEIGSRCLVMSNCLMQAVVKYEESHYEPCIEIGDDVYIGRYAYLVAAQEITIADGCVLSEHVYIADNSHGYDPLAGPIMRQPLEVKGPVRIGPNCFLGYRVAVMPNITLGEWCIVGANSVVTCSFPAYSMIAGAPARLIKVYSHELHRWVTPTVSTDAEGRE